MLVSLFLHISESTCSAFFEGWAIGYVLSELTGVPVLPRGNPDVGLGTSGHYLQMIQELSETYSKFVRFLLSIEGEEMWLQWMAASKH